jgi:hypothetical protein
MGIDLILGKTNRNWARGLPAAPSPAPTSDEVSLRLTEPEMRMLAELSSVKMRADAGDRAAKKRLAKTARDVARLQKKAARGDVRARRTLLVLRESGVFQRGQTIALGGEAEGLVPNQSYRAAVLRQARRLARGDRPTTRHFVAAKSAVDGTMRKHGLAIYLPGSQPGRVTY